jgi:hypothetical protein
MPRDGSATLSDLTAPRLVVGRPKCGRRGSYAVVWLYAERGGIRLTHFLADLTSACPKAAAPVVVLPGRLVQYYSETEQWKR